MSALRTLAVYCGSHSGKQADYARLATQLGRTAAERGIRLVYGGGKAGLMGAVADAALTAGGQIIGVIPRQLVRREMAHVGLSQLEVVETMHQRKTRMFELADAFVALPGGFGTMDEIFEILTWAQLDIHRRPCAFLEVHGYYRALRQMINTMVDEGFLRAEQRASLWFGENTEQLLDWFAAA